MQKKYFLPIMLLLVYIALIWYSQTTPTTFNNVERGFNSVMFLTLLPTHLLVMFGILLYGITITYFTEFATPEMKTHVALVVVFTMLITIYDFLYSFNPVALYKLSFISSTINIVMYLVLLINSLYFIKSKENTMLKYLVVLSSLLLFFQTGLVPMLVTTVINPTSMDNIIAFYSTYNNVVFVVFMIIAILRVVNLYKVFDLE